MRARPPLPPRCLPTSLGVAGALTDVTLYLRRDGIGLRLAAGSDGRAPYEESQLIAPFSAALLWLSAALLWQNCAHYRRTR